VAGQDLTALGKTFASPRRTLFQTGKVTGPINARV
jgi:hypothetical protein